MLKTFVNVIKGQFSSHMKNPYKSLGKKYEYVMNKKGMKREVTKEKTQTASEFLKVG